MEDIQKMLMLIVLVLVQRTPAIIKQLRKWHLDYLKANKNNQTKK
ncbi:hypothetical protein QOK74_08385 [Staphylococcus saprophyticus]|nr:hypothetical protein [Staphylococcus saprophyticus]MDK1672889.1 hypothetical protein [Staphylococcus saprophyticus]